MVLSQEPTTTVVTRSRYNYQLSEIIRQRAWVEIDQSALAHNVRQLRAFLSPDTELMAVVKADAYGHGAIKVAQTALQYGASRLAIATLGEGIELREAGIIAPIVVLGAVNNPEEIAALCHWKLQPTICTFQQAITFSKTLAELEQTLSVHLKLDTGMSRLGTLWHQATEFVTLVHQLPYLKIASIYSHLATADELEPTVMKMQQQRFKDAIEKIKAMGISIPCLHLANSAAVLSDRSLHYDLVRVGLAMYGLYPAPHLKSTIDLKPVLQVKAKITQVKTIAAGTGVSYGYQYITQRETKIAVVSIGYADGVPRNLSNRLKVLLRGQYVPQIGAITMDQIMLDVTNLPDVEVGDIVTLIGKDGENSISADDWAKTLGTISWEILCSFKHRLPRISTGEC
ncbi:alanine racemase [Chroococcus sp. FPU101]|uniref:alanine racemase n=1 Tax=Chroococcus sp. FPU101 TaxID=1974212 RepID=UPI001A8D0115|nr:alanine racemase [Chroococcus sp. FPU101]GFE67810.1 alanine racemase [Chroococcus sp. FPU101]